jgi:hypothetical protein
VDDESGFPVDRPDQEFLDGLVGAFERWERLALTHGNLKEADVYGAAFLTMQRVREVVRYSAVA